MKSTFAVVVVAALSPCLLAIDRITAAETPAAAPQELKADSEEGLVAVAKAACEDCCEKSCRAEKACAGEKSCCTEAACTAEKTCCEDCTATTKCEKGSCESTATAKCEKGGCNSPAKLDSLGLKLFWTLPLSPAQTTGWSSDALAKPWPSSPCQNSSCQSSECGNSACAGLHASTSLDCGVTEFRVNSCTESKVHYAAIPAAVPSPFSIGNESLSPPILGATQYYSETLPLQAPPAPVAQASATVAAPQPAQCPKCTAPTASAAKSDEPTQVLFSIDVVVDESDSLKEFESLQSEMPFLTADSEIVLATFKILENQKLVRTLWNPKLVTTVGHPATFKVGMESPGSGESKPSFDGFSAEIQARELGGGLAIEFTFCDTSGGECYKVATSMLIAHGQTIVMKANRTQKGSTAAAEKGEDKHPVYVVLTPQVVK